MSVLSLHPSRPSRVRKGLTPRRDVRTSSRGQVFLESAVVLPVVLFSLMAVIQVAVLIQAAVRFQAAAAHAVRSHMVQPGAHQSPSSQAGLRNVRAAVAVQMAPVSPSALGSLRWALSSLDRILAAQNGPASRAVSRLDSAFGAVAAVERIPGVGTLISGVDRLIYAWTYTRVEACSLTEPDNADWKGQSLRLRIRFDVALLVPVVSRVLARRLPDAVNVSISHRFAESPVVSGLAEMSRELADLFVQLAESAEQLFRGLPKRTLVREVSLIWPRHQRPPGLSGVCRT